MVEEADAIEMAVSTGKDPLKKRVVSTCTNSDNQIETPLMCCQGNVRIDT